jgi:hypothetical protein
LLLVGEELSLPNDIMAANLNQFEIFIFRFIYNIAQSLSVCNMRFLQTVQYNTTILHLKLSNISLQGYRRPLQYFEWSNCKFNAHSINIFKS